MSEQVSPSMLEFLGWVSSRRRTYEEAMEAWQTTCPRHTIWEDAVIDGLIRVGSEGPLHQSVVTLTTRGKAILDANSRKSTESAALAH